MQMSTNTSSMKMSRPLSVSLIAALALFQVIRISAFGIVKDVLANTTPTEWLFPAIMDIIVGVMAIFVAFGLWKGKGLLVWTAGIVFFFLSISDHLDAIVTVLNTHGSLPAMMSGAPSSTATMLSVMSLVEIVALWKLTSTKVREYFQIK